MSFFTIGVCTSYHASANNIKKFECNGIHQLGVDLKTILCHQTVQQLQYYNALFCNLRQFKNNGDKNMSLKHCQERRQHRKGRIKLREVLWSVTPVQLQLLRDIEIVGISSSSSLTAVILRKYPAM